MKLLSKQAVWLETRDKAPQRAFLVTQLQLGNAAQEAPASPPQGKLELPLNGSQAPAWEPGEKHHRGHSSLPSSSLVMLPRKLQLPHRKGS
jgi:hypothetical protein